MPTDDELRINHEFVSAFEGLRKQFGLREMNDAALHEIADTTGHRFESLRVARHIRNAIAHDDPVNRELVVERLAILRWSLGDANQTAQNRADRADVKAYRVHAWKDSELERQMIANGFVSIGGAEIDDLTSVEDPEFIRANLTRTMPEATTRAINLFVGYWRRFLWEAEPGDLVVLPTRDRAITIGEFVGTYHYVATAEPHARHRRAVSWNATGISREKLEKDLITVVNGQHTVQDFKTPDAASRLVALADTGFAR